ncbi:hypothetical protein HBH56_229540 [Parastagonospora nodorum]|uniref:Uncharacterized protein n=2 Tax=Phaeosphaeria nodorum (strain SN15 / ATCC MYA-4574 / FGSC 10173) TaxID=321614 RepID=A0A7U2I513_PHANO|nr:hypothetical protein SNOG_16058 [Parastagonospora nodorum SN15]KAH3904811.1 hypothetical protein HBH56_229540 [Parastagonospora nodorum]EAT76637.1 hypothetical protein SNOG_16058 [Parastagonospora nodorum SN15]KAH3921839.1 hypothetical protein HBH54_233210 [Parastagonospora nodorum]KAH3939882.1 hypothetical protein HBH53_227090 [Parastagonospora nodorum]KAH3960800.1 hypothetical protein HBH52_234820 [Parastagonospora nodorum]
MSDRRKHGEEILAKSSDDEPSKSLDVGLSGIAKNPYPFPGDEQPFSWTRYQTASLIQKSADEAQGEQQASASASAPVSACTTNASRDVQMASPEAELDLGEFVQLSDSSPEKESSPGPDSTVTQKKQAKTQD